MSAAVCPRNRCEILEPVRPRDSASAQNAEVLMVELTTPICDCAWKAVDFALPGVDGKTHMLAEVRGPKGTLIVFPCNHGLLMSAR
jgi:hypothetical protein